jgi:predicted RNA-binding Zn-ribbon protein involved in translation (DUF1610 family)
MVFHAHSMVELNCPHCGAIVAMLPYGVCSWLGAPMYRCGDCGVPYASGRVEWTDMTRKRKAWYVGVSLLYSGVIGGVGGVSIAGAVHFLRNGPWKNEIPVGTLEQGLGTLACAVLVGAIQIERVFRSLERSREREYRRTELGSDPGQETADVEVPCQPAFWFGLPGLAILLIFAPATLGWLVALLR